MFVSYIFFKSKTMGLRKVVICSNDKGVSTAIKDKVEEFIGVYCPKKDIEIVIVAYDSKINGYGLDYCEHIDPRKIKRYFTKAKSMALDKAGGLASSIFVFAPKIVTKIGMNHAEAGIGVYTNKDHRSMIMKYVKMQSTDGKPSGAEKIRKWYCKRVEEAMGDDKIKWGDIAETISIADVIDPTGEL